MDAKNFVIKLPECLTIAETPHLHQILLQALEQELPLTLDESQLCRIDCSGLQLLLAFVQEALTSNRTVNWLNQSDVLVEGALQLGIQNILCGESE
jgi:anti-anti-sigma regulatory factor